MRTWVCINLFIKKTKTKQYVCHIAYNCKFINLIINFLLGTITPTPSQSGNRIDLQRAEEFEMTKLLSNNHKEEGNTKIVQDVMGCEVVMRRNKNILQDTKTEQNGNNSDDKMALSRTSDLTASITSNDLTIRGFDSPMAYYNQDTKRNRIKGSIDNGGDSIEDDDEMDGDRDSGGGGSNSGFSETDTLLNNKKASHILNLTHIEDTDICFADD